MIRKLLVLSIILFAATYCSIEDSKKINGSIKYNLIEPGSGIYAIIEKDVSKNEIENRQFETVYYESDKIVKIERYDKSGMLTDEFDVAAITVLEYSNVGNVKFLKYFDKAGNRSEDQTFGYWSIEYIYDEKNRVRMEIYRDKESKFLKVPRDNSGNIAKVNFLSPILTYEYSGDKLIIKALDQKFNLLKEVYGDKPCVPFIDCGDNN